MRINKSFLSFLFLSMLPLFHGFSFESPSEDHEDIRELPFYMTPLEERVGPGAYVFESGGFYPRDAEFTQVTDSYGPLVVQEGKFEVESTRKPWSSWWYPLWERRLFDEGERVMSTLGRFDRFVRRKYRKKIESRAYEKNNIYNNRAVAWAGRCDAWAVASALEDEPKKGFRVEDLNFRVRDIKALLIKTYENIENLTYYGQRNDAQWDSIYADLYPEQFHLLIQKNLRDQKKMFLIDHDAGIEVWNTPVYKAKYKIKADPSQRDTLNVKIWVYTADPHLEGRLDFVGLEEIIRIYTYNLYGSYLSDGRFQVTHGEWTGSSRADHPDFAIEFPEKVRHSSMNKFIKKDWVSFLLSRSR